MELSIIILTFKVPHYLNLCLSSVRESIEGIDAEVIVVNNAKDKATSQLVQNDFPEFIYLQNDSNLGFSAGNNVGVKRAKGSYICLLNPDTIVGKNTFKNLLAKAKSLTNLGALGPYLMNGTGHFLPESKRNIPTPQVVFSKLLGKNESYYPEHIKTKDFSEVEILVGAFMLMRKDRYWQVGGLDETYFMYGEDIDLSYSFLKHNYKNYYLGSEKVIHFKGESTVKNKVYVNRFYNAMLIFYNKHFNQSLLLSNLAKMMLIFIKLVAISRVKKHVVKRKLKIKNLVFVNCNEDIINAFSTHVKFESAKKHQLKAAAAQQFKEKESLFILDANQLSYQQIINLIVENHDIGLYYRIRPKGANYIIGSDSSYIQGEVLEF